MEYLPVLHLDLHLFDSFFDRCEQQPVEVDFPTYCRNQTRPDADDVLRLQRSGAEHDKSDSSSDLLRHGLTRHAAIWWILRLRPDAHLRREAVCLQLRE